MDNDKRRTVLVKCLIVSSDGYAVGHDGEEFSKGYPMYEWDKRRRSVRWLANPKNKKLWREVKK
jgi:hypothetical protein